MTPPTLDDLANCLTPAQIRALTRRRWSMIHQYNAGIAELIRYGLLEPDGRGHGLSALGYRLREHLRSEYKPYDCHLNP